MEAQRLIKLLSERELKKMKMEWNSKKSESLKNNMETLSMLISFGLLIFVLLLKSPLHLWIGADAGTDSSVFKTVVLMMENGYMPYRDTFDHKGPLIYFINWIGNQVRPYRGIWVVEFINLYITFIIMYKTARLKCGKIQSYITLLVAISLLFSYFKDGNYTEEYAMPFIATALYIFLDYLLNRKISNIKVAICGFSLGCVCLLRINMIPVWIVFCTVIFTKCICQKEYSALRAFVIFFITGVAVIFLPTMLWLFMNHALQDFWNDYILFNLHYTSASGGRALFSAKWNSFFVFLNNPVIILSFMICIFFFRRKNSDKLVYGSYICFLFINLLFICLSGMTYEHYGMILVPAVVFPIASLYGLVNTTFKGDCGKIFALSITACFLCFIVAPDWLDTLAKTGTIYNERNTDHISGDVSTVCKLIEEYTSNEDKISVYGNWDNIYVRSDRLHATKYSYQFPIGKVMPEIREEYWQQMNCEYPRLIVVQAGHYDTDILDFVSVNNYEILWAERTDSLNEGAIVYIKQ